VLGSLVLRRKSRYDNQQAQPQPLP